MATIFSNSRSQTQARKYLDRERPPRFPKYWPLAEAVHISNPVDLYLLCKRLEADPRLWFVQGNPGQPNAAGFYRRSLQPLPVAKDEKATDPAGLVAPVHPELLIFDLDDNRWPPGCDQSTAPRELAAAVVERLFAKLDRPPCSAVIAFSGSHLVKGCRAKAIALPDRNVTWDFAGSIYARAGADTSLRDPALPIFLAPPQMPADRPDPLPGGRVYFIPAPRDLFDCSPRPGDGAVNTWKVLRQAERTLEKVTPGDPRHPVVNRQAFLAAGVAAGEGVPVEVVVDTLLGVCRSLDSFADRDFEDEIRRGAADGYRQPVKPLVADLVVTKEGDVKALMSNAAVVLSHRAAFQENDFGDQELVNPPPWDPSGVYPQKVEEYQVRQALAWLQSTYRVAFRKSDVSDAVGLLAGNNRVNHLTDYLTRCGDLPAGELTLDNAAVAGWDAQDTPAHRLAIRRFLLQCVARAFQPGCQGELVLTLHAPPGRGKGRSAWCLFTRPGERYFTSSHIAIGNQAQHAPILRGLWGAELGEQRSVSAWHQDAFKAFLSLRKILYRVPYEIRATEIPLRVNYVWTTEHETPLSDDNWRRFLVVNIARWREWPGEAVDRLWGDAVRAYAGGERHWLNADDETILEPARALAYDADALEPIIEDLLHGAEMRENLRAIDTVIGILSQRPNVGIKISDCAIKHRVGKCMKRLGWVSRPTWSEGKIFRAYFPPEGWLFRELSSPEDLRSY